MLLWYMIVFFFVADREVQRILLELLNQMDGFDQNVNVKVRFVFSVLSFYDTICQCIVLVMMLVSYISIESPIYLMHLVLKLDGCACI